jgi:hypothetical protein
VAAEADGAHSAQADQRTEDTLRNVALRLDRIAAAYLASIQAR